MMTDRRWSWAGLILLGAASAGFLWSPFDQTTQRLWYNATAVGAMAFGFRGLRVHRPVHRRGWVLTLTGFSGWVCGDLVWLVQQAVGDTRFPAPSDAVYLASYVVLAIGILVIVRTRRSGGDRAAFLDAAILTTGAAVPAIVFMIAPLDHGDDLSVAARLVSTAYPVGDIFLLAALARMLLTPGARNRSFFLLLAALALTTVADSTWNVVVASSGDAVTDSHLLDAAWLFVYVLVAAATNTSTMRLVAEPSPPTDVVAFGRRRIAAMSLGLLLPIVVLAADGVTGGARHWPIIAAGTGLMCVLVVVRFLGLLSIVQSQAVQLAALAGTDPLTGAANRRTWEHELSRACLRAREDLATLSVAIIDLDHFKVFNDTFGHPAGDQLLREAVAVWGDALPADATLARYGGEEFAVLLPGYRLDAAVVAISALREGTPKGQTFSAGIAEWAQTGSSTALVAAADTALYQAKRDGRNQIGTAAGWLGADARQAGGELDRPPGPARVGSARVPAPAQPTDPAQPMEPAVPAPSVPGHAA